MSVIKKYSILKQLALTLDCYVPRLCLFITILAYVLFGNYINPEKVYLATAYYNVLRNSMIFGFSLGKIIDKIKNRHFLLEMTSNFSLADIKNYWRYHSIKKHFNN